jgi:5-(carboxyamino)imidazole ribonucleotide synthase
MSEASVSAPLPPGSTVGILGSGQLGRMLAMAAARLGLKTHIYCEESGPAFDVATHTTKAAFDDTAALTQFAGTVQAVTYEFENVPIATAQHLARRLPVRPSAKALEVAQDRLAEKQFVAGLGIPVAPFHTVEAAEDIATGLAAFAGPAILKTRRFGYDGKGQAGVGSGQDAATAWDEIGARPAVLEKRIDFAREISALVVRGTYNELAFYDCPVNTHEDGILRRSTVPSGLPSADLGQARDIAAAIASALDYVGVLTVGNAEMVNLIGQEALDWRKLAAEPGACLHLYGKRDARAGRKMGHVTRLSPK